MSEPHHHDHDDHDAQHEGHDHAHHDHEHGHAHAARHYPFEPKTYVKWDSPFEEAGAWTDEQIQQTSAWLNDIINDLNDPNQEHPLNWPYWHYIDIATDTAKGLAKHAAPALEALEKAGHVAGKAAPFVKNFARAIPVVGVVAEGIHVYKPYLRVKEDYESGRITKEKYDQFCAGYIGYTASGALGIYTAFAKEGLTLATLEEGWLEEEYVPHSLWQEAHHANMELFGWKVPDPKPIVHDVATKVKETIRDAQEAVADLKEKPAEIKTGIQQKFSEAKAHVDRFFDQAGNPHHHTIGEVCDVCQSALSSFIPALAPKLREQDKKVDSPAA